MPAPTYRPSRFLHLSAAFTVLGALQVLLMPWVYTDFGGEWTIAWCSPRSELWEWAWLFAWTFSAAPILFFTVRSRVWEAHVSTILACGLFWLLAFGVRGFDRLQGGDVLVPAAVLAFMIWRVQRGCDGARSTRSRSRPRAMI